jgi:ribosomal protein L16 Arg81 hydroxylase
MRPYTDVEYGSLPHVILISDVDWDPRVLDFDNDDNNNLYDAISDKVNHSKLFKNAFGDYKGQTSKFEVSSANT